MTIWDDFHGPNAGYILELYEQYQQDPASLDSVTRSYFEQAPPPPVANIEPPAPAPVFAPAPTPSVTPASQASAPPPTNGAPRAIFGPSLSASNATKIFTVVNYARAIRDYGHLGAQLDPLGTPPPGDPSLDIENYGLTEADLNNLPASLVDGPLAQQTSTAAQALQALREVYVSSTGYDLEHVHNHAERNWLRDAIETSRFTVNHAPIDEKHLLKELTEIEGFEQFLHRTFPGKTRFSIEGLEMMVPILNEMISAAVDLHIYDILIGMAHRGRLNVLTHVLKKPYGQILAEFKDPIDSTYVRAYESLAWTGDVKYHTGAAHRLSSKDHLELKISIAPNPSHLEHVNPVVLGMARAAATLTGRRGPAVVENMSSVPVLIHGDAAFSAQGIVAETLNLHRLPGYTVGGTLHIIANNQVGFTTDADVGRSTTYASDLAKGFEIPIVHVNADDPEACIAVARLAFAYMAEFHKDFVIDLIGYRRYGHNEGDEPRFTQPMMYNVVQNHPSVREIWAKKLIERGLVTPKEVEAMLQKQLNHLQQKFESFEPKSEMPEPDLDPPEPGTAKRVKTGIKAKRLKALHASLLELPENFALNSKLKRLFKRRGEMLEDYDKSMIDWGTAETLAFASILADGIAIRLTGEDVGRGTFSHRHAVLRDQNNGESFAPLQSLPQARASFEIYNSPLSENAAVGFEYGYNIQAPDRLVIWEAQYGDFVNGAQAIIDEFVVSGHAKWGQTPSLMMLLPNGHEGQGPDHSTGRVERFLQSAAEINMRIVNCTTAAQYFHLLRRQATLLIRDPLPLIVMAPKSLLRHPLATASLKDLVEGKWQPFIDDEQAKAEPEKITQVVLCSGKFYVDLVTSSAREQRSDVAVVRIEQLYPLLGDMLSDILNGYPNLKKVIWAQEEPKNMGAWSSFKAQLIQIRKLMGVSWELDYIGRPRRASPAEGTAAWHKVNQEALIERIFS
ncbi:2-oxoglutarate dehydrogenase E1 component [Anaerolineales bacterium HSG25]|nr:2-oxoglutarate dehydrogenase E1 component [Anaerolineales bacterium HSG25]